MRKKYNDHNEMNVRSTICNQCQIVLHAQGTKVEIVTMSQLLRSGNRRIKRFHHKINPQSRNVTPQPS